MKEGIINLIKSSPISKSAGYYTVYCAGKFILKYNLHVDYVWVADMNDNEYIRLRDLLPEESHIRDFNEITRCIRDQYNKKDEAEKERFINGVKEIFESFRPID